MTAALRRNPPAHELRRRGLVWRGAVLGGALALAGCAEAPGFRDTSAPMGATTRFDAARFAGLWQVVERVGPSDALETAAFEKFRFAGPRNGRIAVIHERVSCNGGICVALTERKTARLTAPGRFAMDPGSGRDTEHWVLWIDADFRTAVIGAPDGRFGWIMDRRGPRGISPDRLRAAREIMGWAGYDLTALRRVEE